MKIKRIKKVNLGPFQDFKDAPNFVDSLNIIFGWNGSGKTIISRIFNSIEVGKLVDKINGIEFEVETDIGNIKHTNLSVSKNKIRVFNEDYLNDAIRAKKTLPYIFVLGKTQVNIEKLEEEKRDINEQLQKLKCEDEHGKIAEDVANNIIKQIDGIGTINKELQSGKYNSYDKSSFRKRIEWIKNKIDNGGKIDDFLLQEEQIEDYRKKLRNQGQRERDFNIVKKWHDWIFEIEQHRTRLEKINENLARIPIYKESIRLSSLDEEEKNWVFEGVVLHKFNTPEERDRCLFCNSQIKNKEELLKHFTEDVRDLDRFLSNILGSVKKALQELDYCQDFYQEEKEKLVTFFSELEEKVEKKLADLSDKIKALVFKELAIQEPNASDLSKYAHALEKHYVAEKYEQYQKKFDAFNNCISTNKELTKKLAGVEEKIRDAKAKIKNVNISKDRINTLLKLAFPYKKFELQDASDGQGYVLLRNGFECKIEDLSEGERNFLVFAYFIVSLYDESEDGKLEDDAVIVIDDPVSSLDSDSLFYVFSILKNEIEMDENKNRQFLVMTHNLDFLGHLLQEFDRKDNVGFYQIKINTSNKSILDYLSDNLKNYSSEYRYAIKKLNEFRKKPELNDIDEQIFVANLLRRVLETFLYFKFGFHDYRTKLDRAYNVYIDKKTSFPNMPNEEKQKIKNKLIREKDLMYRLTNHGSHKFISMRRIDVATLSTAQEMIKAAFNLIKGIDKEHWESFNIQW